MYEDTTYEGILQRMLSRVPNKFDKREGSVIWDTHSPTAIELQILYLELDTILREAYGDTASREFLILRCKERGISPYPATHAILKGTFTPPGICMTGKRFNIGTINYVVTEPIADGEYQVQCEAIGSIGNQFLGTMIPIDYITGLETAELTEVLIPGEEEEDTEELRQRYFDSFKERAFGGNIRDYLEKTNAIPGVSQTKVTRIWNGDIFPSHMVPTQAVTQWYEGMVGTLQEEVASWLSLVFRAAKEKKLTVGGTVLLTILGADFEPATNALIHTVQETIDPEGNAGEGYGLAPIGHVVSVQTAQAVPITIKTTLSFDNGYGWYNLQTPMEEAIGEYLLELRTLWADSSYLMIRKSQIETRLLSIQGIVDIENTLINDTPGNVTLGQYQVPVFGGVLPW